MHSQPTVARTFKTSALGSVLVAILSCSSSVPFEPSARVAEELTPGWHSLWGPAQINGGYWTGVTMDVENPGGLYRIATLGSGVFEWCPTPTCSVAQWVSLQSSFVPVHNPPTINEGMLASTIATAPGDLNTIIFGTQNDSRVHAVNMGASGIWLTATRGADHWKQVLSPDLSGDVHKIRWSDGVTVHAATSTGYWRSGNKGQNWQRIASGNFADLVVQPANPNAIYLTQNGAGLQKAT